MKYKIIKDKIFYFENAIPNIENLLNYINNNHDEVISEWQNWHERPELGGRDYGHSKYLQGSKISTTTNPDTAKNISTLLETIDAACKIYAEHKQPIVERQFTDDIVLLKYHSSEIQDKASVLGSHIDWPHPEHDEHTILVYYNDDYLGGELIFDELNLTMKPKAGSILIFSATDQTLTHSTREILKGIKHFTLHMWLFGSIKGLYQK